MALATLEAPSSEVRLTLGCLDGEECYLVYVSSCDDVWLTLVVAITNHVHKVESSYFTIKLQPQEIKLQGEHGRK